MKKIISLAIMFIMSLGCFFITGYAETSRGHLSAVPDGYVGVYTIEDLYCISNNLAANYILMNDIDLSQATAEGGDWNYGGRGWNPIGSNNTYSGNAFSGIFDGNGYAIRGLNINIVGATLPSGTGNLYLGVFANVSGTIKNLSVKGKISLNQPASSSVKDYVGGIAGYCSGGTIENCINDVELDCTAPSQPVYVGGIVGYVEKGSIKKCVNIANLSLVSSFRSTGRYVNKKDICEVFIGGMTAYNGGTVLNCINTGEITGLSNGGSSHWTTAGQINTYIVYYYNYCDVYVSGITTQGTVQECYNVGNISATLKEGAEYGRLYVSGITYSGFASDCYNVGNSSGYSISETTASECYFLEGSGKDTSGATQLTDGQMKLKSMYSGFDFDSVWTIDGRKDYPYPELRDIKLLFPGDFDHKHKYSSEVTKEATHLAEGEMAYVCYCGDTYTESIAKLTGHTYKKVVIVPTCTKQGYTTYSCECGDSYVSDYKNANGHKGGTATCKAKAKCTFCGEFYGSLASHNYASATCTKAKTCKVCGATSGSKLGHTYTNNCDKSCNRCGATRSITHSYAAATCTKAKTCKVCGATSGKSNGHKYTNACDTSCNTCKATRKITHAYKDVITKATLSKSGKIVNKCSVCGSVKSSKTIAYPKTFTLSTTKYTYNGSTKTPSVTVKDSAGKTLKNGTDYTVTYASGRKSVGVYKVTITMKGNYTGTKTLTFNILPGKTSKITATQTTTTLKASWSKVTGATGYKVELLNSSGKVVKTVTTTKLTYTFSKLSAGTTYKIRVTAYKTISNKNQYSLSSTTLTTATKPATPTLKVTSTKKGVANFTWTNVAGENGYQVYYSTSKSSGFKSLASYKTNVAKGSKSKLTSGKTYYFKVRSYKKVGSTTIYGDWSKVVSVKIK